MPFPKAGTPWNKGKTAKSDPRISAGYRHYMYGKHPSKETRAKLHRRTPWNKGLTKEDDSRVASIGRKGHTGWNKGLTKEDDIRIAKASKKLGETLRGRPKSEEHKKALEGHTPWNTGLHKGTDIRLANLSKSRTGVGNPMHGGSHVEKTFDQIASSLDYKVLKNGWPDRILVKGDKIYFVEIKSKFGRLSTNQKKTHAILKKVGIDVIIWRDGNDLISFLSQLS